MSQKYRSLQVIASLMAVFYLLGIVLYTIIFCSAGAGIISSVLRAFMSSLGLFVFDIDANIFDTLTEINSPWMLHALLILGCLSSALTSVVVVGLIWSRIKSYFNLRFTGISKNRNHLYIFFGINKPSEVLARDVVKNDPKAIVVFVDNVNLNDKDNDSLQNIVDMISFRRHTADIVKSLGVKVTVAYSRLSELSLQPTSSADIFKLLGIPRLKKLVESLMADKNNPQLHILILSDDEDDNIRSVINLAKDSTILRATKIKDLTTSVYCHARYNGPNRVIEDLAIRKSLHIKLIDSSHIAVELLKLDVESHPVNVVEVSDTNPTTVKSLLDTMVIGFGEVGRDAFRFLYEFGAFVSEDSTEHSSSRSPFRCTAIDIDMEAMKGTLTANMPAIKFDADEENAPVRVELKNLDCNHKAFYDDILTPGRAQSVNYIVIALPDDDLSISLAAKVFCYIRRFRDDMSALRIMVRVNRQENVELMQKIADHYNLGQSEGACSHRIIRLFGCPDRIYSYRLIIDDTIERNARRYYEAYRILTKDDKTWDVRHKAILQPESDRPVALDAIRKLRRKESQDIENVLHAPTKVFLLKKALLPATCPRLFKKRILLKPRHGYDSAIHYDSLTEDENRIMLRLAMLEHIRWHAAHELMGYSVWDGDGTDERRQLHNCMRPWEELRDLVNDEKNCYKQYDFAVVDVSIDLLINIPEK